MKSNKSHESPNNHRANTPANPPLERRQSDAEFKMTKERLSAMLRAFDGMIYICSPDYRIEYMNDHLIRRTGRDATGELCYSAIHDREDICTWCVNDRVFRGETVRWEVQSPKDGRWYYCVNAPLHKPDGTISKQSMFIDITDRKRMEQELEQAKQGLEQCLVERTQELENERVHLSKERTVRRQTESALWDTEERYRQVVDHIGVGIAIISPGMEILAVNRQMHRWCPEVDPSQKPLCYKSLYRPPRAEPCLDCPTRRTFQDGESHSIQIDKIVGGKTRHYRVTSFPLKDASGQVISVIEMVGDITDSVTARQRLEESETRYRTMFESTGTAMMLLDENLKILEINAECLRIWAAERDDFVGKTAGIYTVPGDIERIRQYHALRMKDPASAPIHYDIRIVNKKGKALDILVTASMIPGTGMTLASLRDVTEQRHAEAALKKREKALATESRRLQEVNTALKVLLRQREEDRSEMEKKVLANVRRLVLPYLEKLHHTSLSPSQMDLVSVMETNLQNVISPFLRTLTAQYENLTPREIDVANLVKEGRTAKEIADLLNSSIRSVEFHMNNIRKKLGLTGKKINLRSHLLSLSTPRA